MADMHDPNAWTSSPSRLRRRAFTAFAVSLTLAAVGVTALPGPHAVRAATSAESPSPDGRTVIRPVARTSHAPATPALPQRSPTQRPAGSGQADRSTGGGGGHTTHRSAGRTTFDRLVRLGQPIYCGAGTQPLVALTFDDGPGILSRLALQQLQLHDAPATFFLVGKLIGEPQFDGIVREEARIGAIGDHTWDHIVMTKGSPREYHEQIARTRAAAERASGQSVRLFRPPFGAHDPALDRWVRSRGMLEVVWSIDTGDSQGASAGKIYRTVKANLSPGDIILMHDNRGTTESALPRILDLLDARGLTPVTVPELLAQDPPSTSQVRHHTCS